MDTVEIKNKIINVLNELFSEAGVDKDILEYVDLVDDLGMDSINFVSIIIELETLLLTHKLDDKNLFTFL